MPDQKSKPQLFVGSTLSPVPPSHKLDTKLFKGHPALVGALVYPDAYFERRGNWKRACVEEMGKTDREFAPY